MLEWVPSLPLLINSLVRSLQPNSTIPQEGNTMLAEHYRIDFDSGNLNNEYLESPHPPHPRASDQQSLSTDGCAES